MRSRGNAVPIKRIGEGWPMPGEFPVRGFSASLFGEGLRNRFSTGSAFHAGNLISASYGRSARSRVPGSFWFGGRSRRTSLVTVPRYPIISREDSTCRR